MADEVKADYDSLQEIAQRFSQQSEAIESMMQSVKGAYDPLEQGEWMGLGAQAFFSEMTDEIFPAVQRLIQALAKSSETTNKIAQTFQQAEQDGEGVIKTWSI